MIALLLIWVILFNMINGYEIRITDRSMIFDNIQYLNDLNEFSDLYSPDVVNIYFYSDSMSNPYIGVYFDWMLHLFTSSHINTRFIVLVFPYDQLAEVAELLPRKAIIVHIYHTNMYWPFKHIIEYRDFMGLPRLGLFVLNHEQPWVNHLNTTPDNMLFRNYRLPHIYKKFAFVMRSYYYSPLKSSSFFIPLGPSLYGLFNQSTVNFSKISNERIYYCSFKGKLNYSTDSIHHQDRKNLIEVTYILYIQIKI
jgi:hypothetical protein